MSVLLMENKTDAAGVIDYGPLSSLMADTAVSEIMVNGHREVYVERQGHLMLTDVRFENERALMNLIGQVASYVGRSISRDDPMLDARLPDGSRVNAIVPPLSLNGPALTIRRFGAETVTGEDLVRCGSITAAALDFLAGCVISRRSILISGRTGAGKTTLLNILSGFIPDGERIITIEDAAELKLRQPHWVRLETRPPDSHGGHEVKARDLVRNSLRMRPDRIVVGECRGGEALDMLQAMNTGHEGSLSTIHANSTRDALQRLETLTLMAGIEVPHRVVRDQIGNALHVIVHLDREHDGHRQVKEISEIVGREGEVVSMQTVFTYDDAALEGAPRLHATAIRPRSLDAMIPVRHLLPPTLAQRYHDARLAAA